MSKPIVYRHMTRGDRITCTPAALAGIIGAEDYEPLLDFEKRQLDASDAILKTAAKEAAMKESAEPPKAPAIKRAGELPKPAVKE